MLTITAKKRELLQNIYRLTYKQTEALKQKKFKLFLMLSKEKQVLIEQVNDQDKLFHQQYDALKHSTSEGDSFTTVLSKHINLKELQAIIAEIQQITADIKLLEEKNKIAYDKMLLEMMVNVNQSMGNRQEKIQQYKRMNDYKKNKLQH